jgi:hypothetical protein
MSHRGILVAWVAGLVVTGLLAGWFTLRPALLNKNEAFIGYQQILALKNQSQIGKVPVEVGISIEKISDFSIKNWPGMRIFMFGSNGNNRSMIQLLTQARQFKLLREQSKVNKRSWTL